MSQGTVLWYQIYTKTQKTWQPFFCHSTIGTWDAIFLDLTGTAYMIGLQVMSSSLALIAKERRRMLTSMEKQHHVEAGDKCSCSNMEVLCIRGRSSGSYNKFAKANTQTVPLYISDLRRKRFQFSKDRHPDLLKKKIQWVSFNSF